MTPINDEKISWKSVHTFSEIRKTDTHTHRRGSFIYIDVVHLDLI